MAFVNVCRQSVVAGFWPNGGLGAARNSRHRMIPARYTGSGGLMCDDMKRDDLTLVRLKRRVEFIRIARSGRGHVTPGLVLQVARQDKANADPSEQTLGIGFTASKKVGNSVARNRVKRRLRAAVQEVMHLRAAANGLCRNRTSGDCRPAIRGFKGRSNYSPGPDEKPREPLLRCH